MKKIFFDRIGVINISLIIIFRILSYEVYYLNIDKIFRRKKIIEILDRFSIKWLSYQKYPLKDYGKGFYFKKKELSDLHSKKITELIWNKNLKLIFHEKENLIICLQEVFLKKFRKPSELHSASKQFGNEDLKNTYVWTKKNFYSEAVFDDYKNLKNLYPKFLSYFENLFNLIYFLSYKSIEFFYKKIFLKRKTKKFQNLIEIKNENKNNSNFSLAFFTHCGVIFPNYRKDYFYSEDKSSPFHYSNILHIEWDKNDKRITNETKKFYNEKNISVAYWNQEKIKIKNQLKKNFLYSFFNHIFDLDTEILFDLIKVFLKVEHNKDKLLSFPNLKIVLVGYVNLFPQTISVACRINNIKLIAVQERPFRPQHGFQYLLDKYFVYGDSSQEFLIYDKIDKKMDIIKIGMPTLKTIISEKKNSEFKEFDKFNLKCLVMNITSLSSWYDNGRASYSNWNKNLEFYENFFLLAQKNQEILFLIKSKKYDWLKVEYYESILNKIRSLPNIKILNNLQKWTPSKCLVYSDFGIADSYTRLADEMLALGKPVLIYDKIYDEKEKFLNYGSKIIYKNYKDLDNKISSIKLNFEKYNEELNSIRNKNSIKFDQNKFFIELNKIARNYL